MRKKYLVLLLVPLAIALVGCGKKRFAPPPVPIAPSDLSAEAISANEINLTWKDNATTEKGFYVYRTIVLDYIKVVIIEANSTSYKDTGLVPETTYRYRVSAYNDQGESAKSNEASATTPGGEPPPPEPLEPPTEVRADVESYKLVLLSWKDNSKDEDGFKVRCRMNETVYETIAWLGPDSTFFRHDFLQPMTALEYCIEAYRGDELASSPEAAYATTPCPVQIVYSQLEFFPNTRWKISGELYKNADEPCLVELTGSLYKEETGECVATGTDKFYLSVNFPPKHFEIYIREGGPSAPKCWPNCAYSVEITGVEIDY